MVDLCLPWGVDPGFCHFAPWRSSSLARQLNREDAALTKFRSDGNFATMRSSQMLHYREAQASAAHLA